MHDTATLHERPTLAARRPAAGAAPPGLAARWARDEADVRRAQALRHRVFVGEMGARVAPPRGTPPGLDADRFVGRESVAAGAVRRLDSLPSYALLPVLSENCGL